MQMMMWTYRPSVANDQAIKCSRGLSDQFMQRISYDESLWTTGPAFTCRRDLHSVVDDSIGRYYGPSLLRGSRLLEDCIILGPMS